MNTVHLLAVRSDSSTVPISFEVFGGEEVGLRMRLPSGDWRSFSDPNLFACLISARIALEKEELLLCCQGARSDVLPSGLQQQMDNGRSASVLTGLPGDVEVVDIFDAAEPSQVTSVEEQRTAVFRFFGLPLPEGDEVTWRRT
ncbi:hypothetical protein L6E12_18275 [Actinokineospora sp. PR83]|uniref:hypothetical protein n=1 Tax=Actinokineospora sp. PR83 TaxID=2884908 RepID=UPI001F159E22|nr:hypothetical protein [Actinokineospora sp. PR83]MCG8917730.1 hypothetical protein [Actinokineospora sp. PR83]